MPNLHLTDSTKIDIYRFGDIQLIIIGYLYKEY